MDNVNQPPGRDPQENPPTQPYRFTPGWPGGAGDSQYPGQPGARYGYQGQYQGQGGPYPTDQGQAPGQYQTGGKHSHGRILHQVQLPVFFHGLVNHNAVNVPRHGALLKTLPVHEPNDLYDTTFRLFTLQSPFRMGKTQRAIDLLSDERFVKLDTKLRYFHEKYDTILAGHDERRDMLASVRGTPYRRVERLYYEYIRAQRSEVESMLGRLAGLEDHAGGPKSK